MSNPTETNTAIPPATAETVKELALPGASPLAELKDLLPGMPGLEARLKYAMMGEILALRRSEAGLEKKARDENNVLRAADALIGDGTIKNQLASYEKGANVDHRIKIEVAAIATSLALIIAAVIFLQLPSIESVAAVPTLAVIAGWVATDLYRTFTHARFHRSVDKGLAQVSVEFLAYIRLLARIEELQGQIRIYNAPPAKPDMAQALQEKQRPLVERAMTRLGELNRAVLLEGENVVSTATAIAAVDTTVLEKAKDSVKDLAIDDESIGELDEALEPEPVPAAKKVGE